MSIAFDTPIQYLKGVGPKLGAIFEKRGVKTVGDLIEWYPRAYEDRRAVRSISTLQGEERVSLKAQILSVRSIPMGKTNRRFHEILIGDPSGRIVCKFFRSPYRGYFERFHASQMVRVSGKVTAYGNRLEFHHPEIQFLEDEEQEVEDALIPIYTETEGLKLGKLRQLMGLALAGLYKQFEDPLPNWLREKYNLIGKANALELLHVPDPSQVETYLQLKTPAHYRLIFEEFYFFQLRLAKKKQGYQRERGPKFVETSTLAEKLEKSLPFELTSAQKKAIAAISKDVTSGEAMHRLVQGDVGSGKTLVGLMAALQGIEAGYQAAMMVPTEILSEQHFMTSKRLLNPLGIEVGVLTGSQKPAEKNKVLGDLASGKIQLVIGTHALIQEDVEFHKLGLVIIDEQHRFGVDQRITLRNKGEFPHFLVMTATPIPRSLAMTLYGDLEVTVINELPKGRTPITTKVVFEKKRPEVYKYMQDQILAGRQAYIVYPLVEESEKIEIELKNAIDEFKRLQNEFPKIKFGLLHGQMKSQDKESIMRDFRDKKIDALVSTTVIEVGVDVPNATLMIIEHAERFGLAQLHQLRGRIGRGEHKSVCALMLHFPHSEMARARCDLMAETSDGFRIAEFDLETRGPGEFFGTRQSGMPGFKLANIARDPEILSAAREAAFETLYRDPDLKQKDHLKLKERLAAIEVQAIG